ncbi:hypothetical protein BV22DRAFT_1193151 [Leucogyrophana mollusca]|uniref:Uncharacterized protein n=1 Tax=Leucogyrophana mollusca TaxID=85980 RepID=A0ACB8BSW9_9AGAM|nr:hypothetical protein BV22DRAFT_1193151 [Leucogyrophana mollusca]
MSSTILSPTSVPPSTTSPPIAQLLPLARNAFTILSSVTLTLSRLLLAVLRPLHIFLPVLLSILAPFTLLFDILLDGFVLTPYAVVSGAVAALYPVYVFCGVACVSGAAVGIFGRGLVSVLNAVVAPSSSAKEEIAPVPATPSSDGSPTTKTPSKRRRLRTIEVRKRR